MTEMPDPIEALIAFLGADADLTAQVGTRIFGGELPKAETGSMPRKCVVLRPAGSPNAIGRGWQEYGDLRVDASCYGATPFEGHAVWLALHPALKQMRQHVEGEAMLFWAQPAGGPTGLRDPDADWPFDLSTWQVLAAERAAA